MRLFRIARLTRLLTRRHRAARQVDPIGDRGLAPFVVFFEPLERRALLSRGFAAYYFEATDFAQLNTRRVDSQIDFQWQANPSDPALTPGGFGAHYSGRVMPKFSELYHFYTRSTGGVRVWVDNQLIIDDWAVHPLKDNKGSISLLAGERYDIRLEYFDTTSAPRFELHWMSKRQAREVVPTNRLFASNFDDAPPTAPSKLKTTYVTDRAYKFIWNPSSDDSFGDIVYDVYTAQTRMGSTTDTYFTRGSRNPLNSYTVTVRAVDWAGNVTVSAPLTIVTKATVSAGNGAGLAARYFDAYNFDNFRITRTDPQIDFGWDGTPFPEGGDRHFSARWEGTVLAKYDELYTFSLRTDGAVKLWVGGQLRIDAGDTGAVRELTSAMKLRAGQAYSIRIDYQHSPGSDAQISAFWSSLSTPRQLVPLQQFNPAFVDTAAPSAPAGVSMTDNTQHTIAFGWQAANDDVGVAYYDVYRDGQRIGSTNNTDYTDINLNSDTPYSYQVVAMDGTGKASPMSAALQVRTEAPPQPRNAYSNLAATSFNAHSGVSTNGEVITSLDAGDWVRFDRLDFGSGAHSVHVRLGASVSGAGGRIELRLGSPTGQLIGSHVVQPTGSYGTRYVQRFSVSNVSGVQDLYMVFKDRADVAHVQSIQFSTQRLTRILPLGDSITDGQAGRNSYRYFLYQKLINAGYGVDFVGGRIQSASGSPANFDFDQNHEGHSGWRADHILTNVAGWIQQHDPQIVLLHIGTNDIWNGQSISGTVGEVEQIINAIRNVNSSIKIVVARIIPLANFESQIAAFNTALDDMIAGKGLPSTSLRVVDMYTGFSLANDTFDGVHPNDSGANKMADRWFDSIDDLLA